MSRGYATTRDAVLLEDISEKLGAQSTVAAKPAAKRVVPGTTSKGVAYWLLGSAASVFGGLERLTNPGSSPPHNLSRLVDFKDFDPETLRWYWEAHFDDEVDPKIITHYLDPFYCECRAYGRIQEALDDGTIKANPAVPCYGYMYLGPRDERILEDSGVALRYEDSDSESQESTGEQAPIRAIVKKLARPISGVTVRRQGKILVDIGTLNMLKIYNRDVRAENFRDGLLVDFGFSFTEPNIFLEDYDEESLRGLHLEDRRMFKDMLNEEKIDIKVDIFGERRQYSTRRTDRELTAK
ncbi:hypothetical protein S40288_09917 [Stachybotrys chartarum IBT 40288]|nr:hypothetical protein S40288_09917 [Stachybotrys chartarum IBT 40288]